jgi:hypothetical protein
MNKDRTHWRAVVKDNLEDGTALLSVAYLSKIWAFRAWYEIGDFIR